MIKFETTTPERVEMPPMRETKAKEAKEKRVGMVEKLAGLHDGESHFFADRKKSVAANMISKAKKDDKLSGSFNIVAYAKGEDPKHKDFDGIRIFRLDGKPALRVAAE